MDKVKEEMLKRLESLNTEVSSLNKLLRKYVREEGETFRCSKCNSSFVYIRRKDKKLLCRKCGNVQDIDIDGDDEDG